MKEPEIIIIDLRLKDSVNKKPNKRQLDYIFKITEDLGFLPCKS